MNLSIPALLTLLSSLLSLWPSADVWSQDRKIFYPHQVFWSKTEVNQLDRNNQWGIGGDFVYRRKSGLDNNYLLSEPLRISFRPWVHYQFSPKARMSLSPIGYMHTHEYLGKPEDLERPPYHEWRTTLQFFHHQKSESGKWMHTWRYRYELRWQERPGLDEYRFFTRFRLRYRFRYMLTGSDFYADKTWYAAVSNEIGLNLGRNVVYNTFNQNRLYIGIGHRFLHAARVEVRYVDRVRTRGATGFEFDHGRGLMLGLYIDNASSLGRSDAHKVLYTD